MSNHHSCVLKPIREIGSCKQFTIHATHAEICDVLGPANVTDLDDAVKVKASWAAMDEQAGRKIFVWCYKARSPQGCTEWSACGDGSLLAEVFGDKLEAVFGGKQEAYP